VGCEDGNYQDAAKAIASFISVNADAPHGVKRAGERTALASGFTRQLEREAAPLTVIGFGKINEFEVKGEGTSEENGARDRKRTDEIEGSGGLRGGFFGVTPEFGVAAADGVLAEGFDLFVKVVTILLAEHFAEEHAERAHVAAKGNLLEIAGPGFEFGQPLRPAFGFPVEGH
jgi:hypothetical protein